MRTKLIIMTAVNVALIGLQFLITACGTAKSANTSYAETIQSNLPGYTCFLIRNENGTGVGGNCIKD